MRRLVPSATPITFAAAVFALLTFCAVAGAALLPNSRAAIAIVDTASISDSSTTVGVSDNDMFFVSTDPAQIAERLDKMQSLGVQNIRLAIPWSTVETAPGQYNWTAIDNMVNAAAARGIGVLGVINTTPAWARGTYTNLYAPPDNPATLGTFASALASRYAGKVSAYEVWNEPNSAFAYQPSPDPAGYTALLKAAYTAIKAADPKAQVIGAVVGATQTWGSLTLNPVDFVQQMYAAGAKGYFDALSFHPYQWSLPFSAGNIVPGSPLQQANAIYQLMQANGDGLKKIWSSEYGVPTGIPGVGNQASMINDFLTTWSNLSYAGPTFLYTLVDRNSSNTWDAESTFGLFTDSWIAKAAAQVVKDFIAAHPQNPGTSTPPPPVVTNPFEAWAAAVQASVQAWLQQIAAAIAAAFSPAPAATTTTAKTLAVAQTTTSSTAPSSTTSATPAPATTGEPAALAASGTTAATTTSSTPVATSAAPTSTSASSAAPSTTTQTSAARSSQSTATTTSSAPTTTAVTTTSPSTATSVATTATSTAATTSAAAATGTTSAAPTTSSGPSTTAATTTQQTPATTAAK